MRIFKYIKNIFYKRGEGLPDSCKRGLNFLGIASALVMISALQACVSDKLTEPNPSDSDNSPQFYFALTLSTPEANSSRSETEEDGGSSDGNQEGIQKENKISYAYIYFFDKASKNHLATFTVEEGKPKHIYNNTYSLYAKVEIADLRKLLRSKEANVYVIANATRTVTSYATEDDFQDAKFSITSINETDSYSRPFSMEGENSMYCPMSNLDYFTVDLSRVNITENATDAEVANAALKYFNENYQDDDGNKGNLWNISKTKGTLLLERSIARIDYIKHPSSDSKYTLDDDGAPIFHLAKAVGPNGEKVYLKLKGMQLFNVSKEAFTFRHTSAGTLISGLKEGETKGSIFNHENANSNHGTTTPEGEDDPTDRTSYRWIYDTDWKNKIKDNVESGDLTIKNLDVNYFLNQSMTGLDEDGNVEVTSWGITEETGKTPNGYIAYIDLLQNEFLALRNNGYIPWHYVMENTLPSTEIMGIPFSTGVAFYMEVILKDNENSDIDVKGVYDPTTNRLRITMTEAAGDLKDYYQDPEWITEGEGGYYRLTYRYLIEHNNEKEGTVSGGSGNKGDNLAPMQIGIVRNNIYQLAINSISNLPQPHEPDNGYISVSVNILSWAFEDREIEL